MPQLEQATSANRKIRLGIVGKGGVGKTHLILGAPKPAILDIEGKHKNFVGIVPPFKNVKFDQNRLVDEFSATLDMAMAGRFPDVETLAVDSWTLIEKAYRATMDDDLDTKQNQIARGRQRERIELDLLDSVRGPSAVHLLFTFHEKDEWGTKDGKFQPIGIVPDATKNMPHYLDVLIHLQYDKNTKRRWAVVLKSNVAHLFPVGMVIENPTFETFLPIIADAAGVEAPTNTTKRAPVTQAAEPRKTATSPAATSASQANPAGERDESGHRCEDGENVCKNSGFRELFDRLNPDAESPLAWLRSLGITVDDEFKFPSLDERKRASVLARAAVRAATPAETAA